ncbi:NIPSNAP family protein [Ideonella sp. DXS29W]|uniref:NIPSNAP family protein n=1 Tax=Ideonella lacteola TaxID=2984193 RepID=A0ABU9BY57_9BURK
MNPRLIEIRAYRLHPGESAAFHALVSGTVMPMLQGVMDVVAFGPSPHEPDGYVLVRAFDDLADLQARQDAFYGSEAWRQGPREGIVSRIASMLNTVLWLSPEAIHDMRRLNVSRD